MTENDETNTIERRLAVIEKVQALNEQRVENHSTDIKHIYQQLSNTDNKLDAINHSIMRIQWLATGIFIMYLVQTIGLPQVLLKMLG